MKHARLVFGLVLVLGLALVPFTAAHAHAASTTAAAPLTRGDVIKIVRQEIQREFALRDWQRYSGYIDEYRGADAASLFSLSVLDRATAIGDTKSPVRVIAYADYECPYCKTFETAIAPALHRKFHSQALFVYRFFPLDMHGQVARTEAIAGACVARIAGPDAFRRFTSAVFAKTGSNGQGTKEPTATLAKTAMLGNQTVSDPDSLDTYYSKCTQDKANSVLLAADESFKGVSGTPTIFVVNTAQHRAWRLAGALPPWVFDALITNVIAGRPGDSDWAVEQNGASVPHSD